jgi:hypothetical protein
MPARNRDSQRGGALIGSLVVLFLAAGLSAACLVTAPLRVKDANERIGRARARYLAMGAAAKARAQLGAGLVTGLTSLLGTQQIISTLLDLTPLSLLHSVQAAPDESAASVTTKQQDGTYLITAYAKAQGLTQGVAYVVGTPGGTPFKWAGFGGSGVQVDAAITTDSYSSALGAYSLQALLGLGVKGALASNGSIVLSGGTVKGNATPGPGGSVSKGGATVTGSVLPATALVPVAPVRIPTPASNNDIAIASRIAADGSLTQTSGTLQIPAGAYQLSSLTASSSGVIELTGDTTLYLTGPLLITGSASIKVDAHASLKVYTTAAVSIGGGGIVNLTGATVLGGLLQPNVIEGLPAKVEIFVAADSAGHGPAVTLQTATSLYTAIYAPGSEVRSFGTVNVFGGIVADVLHLAGGKLHFDENLASTPGLLDALGGYQVLARWWLQGD